MQSGWGREPGRRCYKQGSAGLTIAGAVLIALGLLLLFLCIPGWAWAALAGLVRPVMTAAALANLSMVGNVLIFCVGVNLVWGKKVRVANLLPAIVIAVIAAFLPV